MSDTAGGLVRTCTDLHGSVGGLSQATEAVDGLDMRVVQVATDAFDALYVTIFFPEDGSAAWTAGAPVVVAVPPSFDVSATWDTSPRFYFRPELGVVEVQPVLPGWSALGHATSGEPDGGGTRSALAVRETIRFAAGEITTVEGWSLGQLVAQPTCGPPVLMGTSSGSVTAVRAVADHPALAEQLAGLAVFEPASLPQFLLVDTGMSWLDPDLQSDGDGDGVPWDDGRNLSMVPESCSAAGCEMDLSTLAWTTERSLEEIFGDLVASANPGVLYLDRDGSGSLDLAPIDAKVPLTPDVDESGTVDADEDFPLSAWVDPAGGPVIYSPQVTRAASAVFGDEWPEGLADLETAEAFWKPLSAVEAMTEAAPSLPSSFRFAVGYTGVPHAQAWPDRPNVRLMYDAARDGGVEARLNTAIDEATCIVGADLISGWGGGPEPGAPVAAAQVPDFAIPEAVPTDLARAMVALEPLWEAFGPFDRCPGEP